MIQMPAEIERDQEIDQVGDFGGFDSWMYV